MDINFFKKIRVLDGGMGQELLTRGMKPQGTLWSATALLEEKYHKLVYDTHIDFIKAGAEVIVTTTFASRKIRLKENKVEDKFEYLNKKAGEIAEKTKHSYPDVLIAGGLPPQNSTYKEDKRSNDEISEDFYNHAKLINPYVDFFYLDVMCSLKECKIGIQSIKPFKKKFLIGLHIRENGKLPSGEKFISVVKKLEKFHPLGIIASCVSIENLEQVIKDFKKIKVPFGFKINAFEHIPAGWKPDANNPKVQLGSRHDLNPKAFLKICKKLNRFGAKIIGGCCEITPAHIKQLKNNF